jgi:hypothetical protein
MFDSVLKRVLFEVFLIVLGHFLSALPAQYAVSVISSQLSSGGTLANGVRLIDYRGLLMSDRPIA